MTGIPCPRCHGQDHRVIATDARENKITRRRQCDSCGWRFNTHETTDDTAARLATLEKHLQPVVEAVRGTA